MKKVLTYAGYVLLLALIIAAFTTTDKEECKQYVQSNKQADVSVTPYVSEVPFKLLGIKILGVYQVSYYKQQPQNGDLRLLKTTNEMITETYIGIYHSFWKW